MVHPSSPPFLSFPLFFFFFFFLFWPLEMARSRENSRLRRAASGEKEPRASDEDPTQNDSLGLLMKT